MGHAWGVIGILFLLGACADVSRSGRKVYVVESQSKHASDLQDKADYLIAKHDCSFIGFADAKTSLFPPSYSIHENEVHAALKNRAAKLGGNLVIANFYQKPAQGIVMNCPPGFFQEAR